MRQLQELDAQLWSIRRRQERIPKEIAAAQEAVEIETAAVNAAQEQLKALQVQHKTTEGELSTKEAAIKKAQGQLYQVKTNKEYAALQHEIEGLKADGSLLEDDILKMLERVDVAQRLLTDERALAQQKETAMHEATQRLAHESTQLGEQLAQRESQRAELASQVPATALAAYERILHNREGVALVPVVRDACSGCDMVLPPQLIHEARSGERLVSCENCARILYWDAERT